MLLSKALPINEDSSWLENASLTNESHSPAFACREALSQALRQSQTITGDTRTIAAERQTQRHLQAGDIACAADELLTLVQNVPDDVT
jgi:hypothetical protein